MIRKANNNIQLQGFLQMHKALRIKKYRTADASRSKTINSSQPTAGSQFHKMEETKVVLQCNEFQY
jgi:hypothetical protein